MFTARYGLIPYITQICFVFKRLRETSLLTCDATLSGGYVATFRRNNLHSYSGWKTVSTRKKMKADSAETSAGHSVLIFRVEDRVHP